DLAQPAQRQDAQPTGGQGRWRTQLVGRAVGDLGAHAALAGSGSPAAAQSSRSCATSAGVASTSGGRTGPAGSPSWFIAALTRMVPCVRKIPVYSGSSSRWRASRSEERRGGEW